MQAFEPDSDTSVAGEHPLTELKFSDLPLTAGLQAGIRNAGFEYCTPIQQATLPIALEGRDVAGQAQTGTGKTAAYLVAMFEHLEQHESAADGTVGPRALILAPTRELAMQIHSDAVALLADLPYRLALAYGGVDYDKQRRQITDGADVLIGTPGRIIDYFKQGVFHLRRAEVLVLDEADRMFDLGFIKDIRYVLRRLPDRDRRLNMLFSATLSHRVLELAYEHMNDPELIRIDPDKMTVDRVRQAIYFPANDEKLPLLIMLLREKDARRTMVFVNMKRDAERLRDNLQANGINAEAISGDVPQRKRERMLSEFQSGELAVLIGTDVASRGLHVPNVSHVFNYDLPQDAEDYVHRIGRTARAGASGDAISFGCENYVTSLPDIEEYVGHKIPVSDIDRAALAELAKTLRTAPPRSRRPPPRGRSGGGGRRGGGGGGGGRGKGPGKGSGKPKRSK